MDTTQHDPSGKRVFVLGAGYGGHMAALRDADGTAVTIVDPASEFTERVRQHELAAGRPGVTHPQGTDAAAQGPHSRHGAFARPRGAQEARRRHRLRSVSHTDVFGAGDAAGARTEDTGALRMACATALPVGTRAGRNAGAEESVPLQEGRL